MCYITQNMGFFSKRNNIIITRALTFHVLHIVLLYKLYVLQIFTVNRHNPVFKTYVLKTKVLKETASLVSGMSQDVPYYFFIRCRSVKIHISRKDLLSNCAQCILSTSVSGRYRALCKMGFNDLSLKSKCKKTMVEVDSVRNKPASLNMLKTRALPVSSS